jgi:branched-chain amino acid transport system substrate-binding protein
MRFKTTIGLAFTLALATAVIKSPPAFAEDPVKVGVILSLNGPAAAFGIPERDALKLLVDQHNAEAGTRKVDLIYYDEQTNPTEAARGATKLIQQDQVQVIIGPTIGSSALAIMPIAAAAKIPVLAPVGSIPVTAKDSGFFPWVFRTCTNDEMLVAGAMELGIFKAGYKRVAIMYQEDAYGKNSSAYATTLAQEKNVEIVASVSAPGNAVDLTAAATKIRNASPDAVLLWTSSPAMGAAFMRAGKQVGLAVPVIGAGALVQRSFIEAAGGAAEGVTMISIANWDDPSVKLKNLENLLRANGKTPAGFGELLTTAAATALFAAIKTIDGPATGPKIRGALEGVCTSDSPYLDGRFCYSNVNHEGFGKDSLKTITVKSGKFRTVSGN